ncbi:ABC transporter substrate-binding protein [Hylemonella gracilis]|uniref:Putative aliphatic sulfonates-binding protein n=1 Tax=Hylemonella gracilis ATCC 19624 TaxID=887062 RepID=F3KR22_9BURK|nr:ABC transporter substrate-binding protein [Hylemonella gracilis]EGI77723.1 nitrate/sulfonate/bicarbonate family ABC transporter periplasmic ligand binding protein [Hylemonella gracilis ATCC 19624]
MNLLNCLRHRALLLLGLVVASGLSQAADPVVLKVGDISYYNLRASAELSKAFEGAPYKVEWSQFQAGAPLIEALNAGAVDIGFLGDSAFLFAASKSSTIKLIGVSRQSPKTVALLVPKNSTAQSIADLKGKKVAYWPGNWGQQLTSAALAKAGLPSDHVQWVKLLPIDAGTAFQGGNIDAFPVWEPYISQQIVRSDARVLLTAEGLIPALSAIAAYAPSVDAKRAAIADFFVRIAKARAWVEANVDTYADAWAKRTSIDQDVSRHWIRQAKLTVGPLDNATQSQFQTTADFLQKEGILTSAFDVRKIVDTSFAAALQAPR